MDHQERCQTKWTDIPAVVEKVAEILSAAELEFLRELVAGESQAKIAFRLKLAEPESLAVRRSLMHKLGATCTADAVRVGIYAGL